MLAIVPDDDLGSFAAPFFSCLGCSGFGVKWVDFGRWTDTWTDIVDGHFRKSGRTKVGSRGYKKLSAETIPFCRFIARILPPWLQRFLSVTPYYI